MVQSYKGYYKPVNRDKYVGNPDNIIYRSMLEKRVMKRFDLSSDVLYWQSEELTVPYFDPVKKRTRRYFPDFIVRMKTPERYQDLHG